MKAYLKRLYRALKHPVLFILGLVSALESLGVPVHELPAATPWASLLAFVLSWRPFVLALGALLVYFAITHYKHWGVPLTVTKFENELIFDSPYGDVVRFNEELELRAHHDQVMGYHQELSSDGRLEGVHCTVAHCSSTMLVSGPPGHLVVMHIFEKPLPAPALKTRSVQRTCTAVHRDAFTQREDWFEVRTSRYPRRNLTMTINFHPENPPIKERCHALTITADHAIVNLDVKWIPPGADGRERLQVFVPKSFNETHRIIWCLSRAKAGH